MKESGYNRWYKEIKGEDILGYLRKERQENRWKRVVRFKLGNEVRKRKYWKERRKDHVGYVGERHGNMFGRDVRIGVMKGEESWQEAYRWILGMEGEGE